MLRCFLMLLTLAAVGCQQADPELEALAQRQATYRNTGMAGTLKAAAASEAIRPARLRDSLEFARRDLDHSARRLADDARTAGELLGADAKRFFVTNPPLYRRKIAELAWGRPDQIAPNAIILFW